MIPNFDVREEYVGQANQNQYTFNFKIWKLTQLIVRVTDSNFKLIFQVFGTDTTNLTGVTFDKFNGGGTVTLATNLPNNYNLTILLANDLPIQYAEYRNKSSFSQRSFENALDNILGALQRVAYLAQRSFRIGDDLVNAQHFDTTIPIISTNTAIQNNIGKSVIVGQDNKSLTLSPYAQQWASTTFTYSQFQTAALSNQVLVVPLPASAILTGLAIKHGASFNGSGISDVVAQVGIASDYSKFIDDFDVAQVVADTAFDTMILGYIGSWVNPTNLYIQLNATGANLSNLTQGSVTVFYRFDVV